MSFKRGLFGRSVPPPNPQEVNGKIGKKFEAWKTALQKEDALQYMMPLAPTRRKIMDKLMETTDIHEWYNKRLKAIVENNPLFNDMGESLVSDTYVGEAVAQFIKHDIKYRVKQERELAEERANQAYIQQFILWLQGKGDATLHAKTPWGIKTPALELKEVRDYLDSFLDIFYDTWLRLTKLVFNGPNTLNEYWIYYKYVLHAEDWPVEDPLYFLDIRAWFDDDYAPMVKSGVDGPFKNLDDAAVFPPAPRPGMPPPPEVPEPPEAPEPGPELAPDAPVTARVSGLVGAFVGALSRTGTTLANAGKVLMSLPASYVASMEGDVWSDQEWLMDIDELVTHENSANAALAEHQRVLGLIDAASTPEDRDILVAQAAERQTKLDQAIAERDAFGQSLHKKYQGVDSNKFDDWHKQRLVAWAAEEKAEIERLEAEEIERRQKEAAEKAERKAKRKAEREAKRIEEEKAEKARRDAATREVEIARKMKEMEEAERARAAEVEAKRRAEAEAKAKADQEERSRRAAATAELTARQTAYDTELQRIAREKEVFVQQTQDYEARKREITRLEQDLAKAQKREVQLEIEERGGKRHTLLVQQNKQAEINLNRAKDQLIVDFARISAGLKGLQEQRRALGNRPK